MVYYKKRINSQECYCDYCDNQRRNTMITGKKCCDCGEEYSYSEYWFKMKRTDPPIRCSKCRLERRNKLREENDKPVIAN